MYWPIAIAQLHEFHKSLEYFPKTALLIVGTFCARKMTNLEDEVNKVTPLYVKGHGC